jgi:hypothetical protein
MMRKLKTEEEGGELEEERGKKKARTTNVGPNLHSFVLCELKELHEPIPIVLSSSILKIIPTQTASHGIHT